MDSWAEKYISIPNSMHVKTKIVVEGAKKVSFVTETEDILKVSSKGVVEPKVTKYYWSGNVGTTEYNPNAHRVTTQYDYSPYASSASAMIIMNGGDCWASTDAIIALCNKVGLMAHSRNANRDAGAGSGHMNAVAKIGNSYYICEAGYDEKAPRDYNIAKYDEPYIFSIWNGEATVYDYLEDEAESAVVPDTYKGVKVTKIGEMVFAGHDELKNIVLPDTVNTIGEYAFYTNESIKKITIPDSVKSIEEGAFGYCENLENVEGCDGIENISSYAFSDCYKLSSITLPESAVVEDKAFQYSPTKIYRK